MFALFKKEVSNFLSSLIGIMVIVVFLLITGLFLWVFPDDFSHNSINILASGNANLDGLFILAPWVFLFLVPAVTMRSFAEEKRTGTIEMLFTKPLSDWQVIIAKFLACVVLVLLALLPTVVYYITISLLGTPDHGGIIGSYIGLFLLSATFVSIGVFCSSITGNQIVSFIISVFLCGFMYIGFDSIHSLFGPLDYFIQQLGIFEHYRSISYGVVDTRDILYFLGVMVLFLCLTKMVLAKRKWIAGFIVSVALVILVNFVGSFWFARFDLTGRIKLSSVTKQTLRNLDDHVYFKVYLEGDFPARYKKLRRETKEKLDEFRAYSRYVDYEFINPSEGSDKADLLEVYNTLYQQGLTPTYISEQNSDGGVKTMILWPGAMVSYHDAEIAVNLMENDSRRLNELDALANAKNDLEYNLLDAVLRVTQTKQPSIGFLEGHGELSGIDVADIVQTLKRRYHVTQGEMDGKVDALIERREDANGEVHADIKYDAIVIAKPTQPFDEKDKFLIDQYIMHGGKVLWLVEPVFATMDSLTQQEPTIGVEQDLNLDDMLFKYGVRLNRNLLLDMKCASLPIQTGQVAGQPQYTRFRWYYFPLVQPASEQAIVRNVDAVKTDFVSSIDATTSDGNIVKTPLLKTSDQTKISGAPVYITLAMLRQNPGLFSSRGQNVAYLLEGTFPSLYANRINPEISESKEMHFLEESVPTSMIVMADGDLIRNQVDITNNAPLPLGFDKYTGDTYDNKYFVENAIRYLVEGENRINSTQNNIERPLDSQRINTEVNFWGLSVNINLLWQLLNIVVPIVIVLLFGLVMMLIRKGKYGREKYTLKNE